MKTPNEKSNLHSGRMEENKQEVDLESTSNHEANEKINESRELLKVLSQQVKPLVEQGKYENINQAIIEEIYRDENNQVFKSYRQWSADQYQVRKGEKGYVLWARPKENQHLKDVDDKVAKKPKENEIEEEQKFFPIAHVFSNGQVDPREQNKEQQTLDEIDNIRSQEPEQELENDIEM